MHVGANFFPNSPVHFFENGVSWFLILFAKYSVTKNEVFLKIDKFVWLELIT